MRQSIKERPMYLSHILKNFKFMKDIADIYSVNVLIILKKNLYIDCPDTYCNNF